MDAVYVCRKGDENEELRYSLRSLATNAPFVQKVWIAGYMPRWVEGVGYIRVVQGWPHKAKNVRENLRAVTANRAVSDDFILMNDDFYIMKPITEIPVLQRGPLYLVVQGQKERRGGTSSYLRYAIETGRLLESWGFKPDDILAYNLHVPMVMNKEKLKQTILKMGDTVMGAHLRTVYGNMHHVGGELIKDRKDIADHTATFVSSSDRAFAADTKNRKGKAGQGLAQMIRAAFPDPSRFEGDVQ